MNTKKNFRGMRMSALIAALMLVLCGAISSMALASSLPEAADAEQIDYQSESETENIAPETLAVSKEQAITLAQYDLGADAGWATVSADLDDDNGTLYYAVLLTDPIGDAHLRLVNAETGEVTVGSLADGEEDGDREDENGENRKEDRSGEGDERKDGADGEEAPATDNSDAQAAPAETARMTGGQALDIVMQALGADARWIIAVSGSVQTDSGLCYQISVDSPDGYSQNYLVNADTGAVTLELNK